VLSYVHVMAVDIKERFVVLMAVTIKMPSAL